MKTELLIKKCVILFQVFKAVFPSVKQCWNKIFQYILKLFYHLDHQLNDYYWAIIFEIKNTCRHFKSMKIHDFASPFYPSMEFQLFLKQLALEEPSRLKLI